MTTLSASARSDTRILRTHTSIPTPRKSVAGETFLRGGKGEQMVSSRKAARRTGNRSARASHVSHVRKGERDGLARTSCQCLPAIDGSSASGFRMLHNSFKSPSALPSPGNGVSASSCTASTIAYVRNTRSSAVERRSYSCEETNQLEKRWKDLEDALVMAPRYPPTRQCSG